MLEAEIQRRVQLALMSQLGCKTWRNNVGMGWVGNVIHRQGSRVILDNVRPLHSGLVEGSGDLIGYYRGVFVSVEVKTKTGRPRPAQIRWQETVRADGGIAIITNDPQDAVDQVLTQWKMIRSM